MPPLKSRDAAFTGLVDESGRPLDDTMKAARRQQLLTCFQAAAPKVLILELYPFGRRQLRFELEPLVEAARARAPRPWLLCSLRDILNPVSAEKAAWAVAQVEAKIDRVLVHGDPSLVTLAESFPAAEAIADLLYYTGYIVEPAPDEADAEGPGRGEVLVSTGGGAVAGRLIEAALAARSISCVSERRWRILVGGNLPEQAFAEARTAAPGGVLVERARRDFRLLLGRCHLSVSQGGYNSVLEVLQARVPAVVVPFATEGEREQTLRAEILDRRGFLTHLPAQDLSPESLAAALAKAETQEPARLDLDLGGLGKTAVMVQDLAAMVPD